VRAPVDVVVEALEARDLHVRSAGPDRYMARCPAHTDRDPSLSIRDAGDRVLVHCFGGCEPDAIAAALGLTTADLFAPRVDLPAPRRRRRRRELGGIDGFLWRLRELGIDYRCTRDLDTWVTRCPACGAFPLVVHREDGGLRFGCPNGCRGAAILEALR
jgi:hypothetical protein